MRFKLRIAEGFAFGLGFSLALFAVALVLWSILVGLQNRNIYVSWDRDTRFSSHPTYRDFGTLEERMESDARDASVIVYVRYNERSNGYREAIIAEVIKVADDAVFTLQEDDVFPAASLIETSDDVRYGDGAIVFLKGDPPRLPTTYYLFGENDPTISKVREFVSGDLAEQVDGANE